MLHLLFFIFFGFLIGLIAKAVHPGEDPVGCLPTIAIGIAGSFVGGAINWLIGWGKNPLHASGFLMSILGAFICCAAWQYYNLHKNND